jgi:hypothetical protein
VSQNQKQQHIGSRARVALSSGPAMP